MPCTSTTTGAPVLPGRNPTRRSPPTTGTVLIANLIARPLSHGRNPRNLYTTCAAHIAAAKHRAHTGRIGDHAWKDNVMSGISRRQMVRGALLGATAIGVRALAQVQQSVPDVTRAGAPGSTIIPPAGLAVDRPRLTGMRRVIVDTDPGNDDALAILMAL